MGFCFKVFAAVYELTAGCFGEEEFNVVAECFLCVECLLVEMKKMSFLLGGGGDVGNVDSPRHGRRCPSLFDRNAFLGRECSRTFLGQSGRIRERKPWQAEGGLGRIAMSCLGLLFYNGLFLQSIQMPVDGLVKVAAMRTD